MLCFYWKIEAAMKYTQASLLEEDNMERARLSVEWLEGERLERNWTQEHVAEQLGVDVTTIQRWEYGLHKPNPRLYRQLCKLFGKTSQEEPEAPLARTMEGEQSLQVVSLHEMADVYTRFQESDLTMRLFRLVWTWPLRNNARYHELQTLITRELEPKDNTMQENPINRRNALRRLASLPIEIYGLSLLVTTDIHSYPIEGVLTQCTAGITACWHLRKGKDLAFASNTAARYIPTLQEIVAQGPKTVRKEAADLLAQCLLLRATCVCYMNGNHAIALHYRQQAEMYSRLAENIALLIIAVRLQAASHDYADNWKQAMQTATKAKYMMETAKAASVPSYVQSYLYAGLANYQAHCGQKQEALTSLGDAQAAFDAVGDESAPIWLQHTEAGLLLNGGLAYYHLDMPEEAIKSFARIDTLTIVAETQRVEAFTDQVMVEVNREDKPRDMEFCIEHWKQGMEQAITLKSEQAYTEAKAAYIAMRAAWPSEHRIKALRDDVVHW